MTFAENINRICSERGTTLTTIVKRVKNGQSAYVTAINQRGSIPKQEELTALARELDCSVADFFADEISTAENTAVPETTNEDEKDILRIYRSLSRREKHEFMAMVYDFELAGDKAHAVG